MPIAPGSITTSASSAVTCSPYSHNAALPTSTNDAPSAARIAAASTGAG